MADLKYFVLKSVFFKSFYGNYASVNGSTIISLNWFVIFSQSAFGSCQIVEGAQS